jgi:hypothetical protein
LLKHDRWYAQCQLPMHNWCGEDILCEKALFGDRISVLVETIVIPSSCMWLDKEWENQWHLYRKCLTMISSMASKAALKSKETWKVDYSDSEWKTM